MSPTTREAQRAELHKAIWRVANDLRGSVDGWDFKSYVLGMLFYRFISENLTAYLNGLERGAGMEDFDYAKLTDQEAEFGRQVTVEEKGFFILPSELFKSVRARAPMDGDLNETLGRVFKNIEGSATGTASEDDLKGLFQELDPNSNKLGNTVAQRNQKLVKLLNAIGDLNLGNFENHEIDAFGDAYEYLMQMYAADAGKSGGEYYTPQEVSELLAQITSIGKTELSKVYDPAVGSGSLLLKFQKVLGKGKVGGYFGQEINLNTYNLARINMFLHDVPYEKFHLAHGDTLTHPEHWDDEPFEAIVSNPPYSIKWEGDANPLLINDPRFAPAGVLAPKSKADLAFTMHILSWLAVNGTAAIVEFPGVMYRGGAEARIRKYLVDNNYVDAVIQLPPDLFFGTTIATCILVLKKSKTTNDVVFIDASAEFTRVGNKNKLTDAHRERILTTLVERAPVEHFAALVSNLEIVARDAVLSVSAYVKAEDSRDAVDISVISESLRSAVARQESLRIEIEQVAREVQETWAEIREARWRPMGEVGTFIRGRRFTKADVVPVGIPSIHYGEIYTHYGVATDRAIRSVREELRPLLRFADPGDVVIASAGETVDDVGKAVAWLGTGPVAIHDDTFAFRHDCEPKYVAYWMQSESFRSRKSMLVASAKIKRLSSASLASIPMPVPSRSDQRKVVGLLETLESRTSDLLANLDVELVARRKQYEYYRDKLLTFEEAPA